MPAAVPSSSLAGLETGPFLSLQREETLSFDTSAYPFAAVVKKALGLDEEVNLAKLHHGVLQPDEGGSTSTRRAKRRLLAPFEQHGAAREALNSLYDRFVREVIAPHIHRVMPSQFVVYGQCCLRVQPPSPVAIGVPHCDANYGHQPGQINFWLPLVDVCGASSLHVESMPGQGDFHPLDLRHGEVARFYGNRCVHYTVPNQTDTTRVSLDFRVVPGGVYDPKPTGPAKQFRLAPGGFATGGEEVLINSIYYRRLDWDEGQGSFVPWHAPDHESLMHEGPG